MSAIEAKLRSLAPKSEMTTSQMMVHLGMNPEKMDWDAESDSDGFQYYTRIEGGTREVRFEQVRNDPDYLAPDWTLLSWKLLTVSSVSLSRSGLRETASSFRSAAKPDAKARYLDDQPIIAKWSPDKQGYFSDRVSKQAAEWHDARVPEWNRQLEEIRANPRHLPAADEVKTSDGTFTLRLPLAYEPDGSWGLVLHHSRFAGRYLPLRLREACDKYKLLYVGLQPSIDPPPGYYWKNAAQILDCIVEMRKRYKVLARANSARRRVRRRQSRDVSWDSSPGVVSRGGPARVSGDAQGTVFQIHVR